MVEEGAEGSVRESDNDTAEVLETPNRRSNNHIAAPIGKIEDSPVFNFLNSLSPIKPVKSIRISQTINPLNLASLPSIFTSPHVNSPRDYKILRRHQLPDPSKPEFASDHGNKAGERSVNDDGIKQMDAQEENPKVTETHGDLAGETSFDGLQFVVDYSEDPSDNSTSPRPISVLEAVREADIASSSTKLISCDTSSPPSVPYASDVVLEGENLINQNSQVLNCEWDRLLSDSLIFESPNDRDSYTKSMDPGSSLYIKVEDEINNIQSLCSADSTEQLGEDSEPGPGNEIAEAYIDPGEKLDYEVFGLYRGMRRRCLVFEMGGGRKKQLEESLGSESSSMLHPEGNDFYMDQNPVPTKRESISACRALPGIGLHLNSLAATSKDYRIISHDSSASGRLLIGPGPSVNFHSSVSNEVHCAVETENAMIPLDDGFQASEYMETDDTNQTSPKKKRRRAEASGDVDGCKRCNCKKSKCLKLYCECFAAGVYCVELCACVDCFNKPVHEDTVLATRKQIESRNPLAFAPKVIRGSDQLSEAGDDSSKTPASARHKRGCNCKKSGCLKKYCECYQGGVGCSVNCRCEGCKNAFGRKDGMEADIEDDESMDATEKLVEKDLDSAAAAAAVPATPLQGTATRQALQQHHLSSKKKPPRGAAASLSVLGKRSLHPPAKLAQHLETVKENEMPDVLEESSSPSCVVKSSSPNGKRVSPPHRSSRKLILRSIPSFPSLTQNQ